MGRDAHRRFQMVARVGGAWTPVAAPWISPPLESARSRFPLLFARETAHARVAPGAVVLRLGIRHPRHGEQRVRFRARPGSRYESGAHVVAIRADGDLGGVDPECV